MNSDFCLVDWFYISAERLFDRTLIGVPIVALFSSGGCVVSRCLLAESRDYPVGGLGIRMGAVLQN